MDRLLPATAAVALLWSCPVSASAHLITSGVGPFYDGVAHLFASPDDLVVAMALAGFGGLSGRRAARRLVVALPVCWLIGAQWGMQAPDAPVRGWLPALCMVGAGGLTALNPRLPVSVPAVIAGAMGLVHGTLNGQAIAAAGMPFLSAWGIAATVAMLVLLLAARVSTLHAGWPRIAARTLGSWAAAIGVLALAWHFRPAG